MTLEEIQKLDSIPKELFEQYSNNVSLVTQRNINDVGLMSLFNTVDELPETDRLFFKKLISCFLKAKKWDDLPENTVFN